jgi:hypothetical protein
VALFGGVSVALGLEREEMVAAKTSSKVRDLRIRARQAIAGAVEIYGTFDERSLGLARIYLGGLLIHDLVRRLSSIQTWYSNDGILPNHTVLWRPMSEYMFSFFFAASRAEEAAVMFAVCALVFVAFTIGYRTRVTHVLAFMCMVSIQYREAFLENGGDIALKVLCAWTLFLPMGARFSVDSVRASLASRRERSVAELNDRKSIPLPRRNAVASLAFFAILLQLATIYYFNAVNKRGWTWHRGSAVHYVLYQERMITWFSLLIRDHVNLWLSRALTWSTLGIEYAAPIFLLTPFVWKFARRVLIVVLPLMHLGFAACLNLGQFSFNMLGFFPLLLTDLDWDLMARYLAPAPDRARTVHVREASPLGFAWARLLSRIDRFERLTFAPAPPVESGQSVQPIVEVENPRVGRRTTGAAGFAECVAALPCGAPIGWLLGRRPLLTVADVLGRFIARREGTVAKWLRLAPVSAASPYMPAAERGPSPARRWLRRGLSVVREVSVIILLVSCASQLLVENNAIPQRFKLRQPKWITQIIWYPRLTQGWQMFSPDAPTGERMLYVDAVTFNGRHVDPLNEVASRVSALPVSQIPPHLEQDEFWHDYVRGIPENEAYWRAMKEWIFNYHHRTGRIEDRIISFEARLIETENPPPGERGQRNIRTKVMTSARE